MRSHILHIRPCLQWAITLLGVACLLALSTLAFTPTAHAVALKSVNFSTSQVHDDCASASGKLAWYSGVVPSIQVYGSFSQSRRCSGSSYLYLSWNSPTHHNISIAHVSAGRTAPILKYQGATLNPGHIALTVCSTRGGWHCARPFRV